MSLPPMPPKLIYGETLPLEDAGINHDALERALHRNSGRAVAGSGGGAVVVTSGACPFSGCHEMLPSGEQFTEHVIGCSKGGTDALARSCLWQFVVAVEENAARTRSLLALTPQECVGQQYVYWGSSPTNYQSVLV